MPIEDVVMAQSQTHLMFYWVPLSPGIRHKGLGSLALPLWLFWELLAFSPLGTI